MKSISFLRNTWKKREQKTPLDGSDNTPPSSPRDSRKQQFSKSTTTSSRSLTVTLRQLPVEDTSALQVGGSWQISNNYQPPSPIYDQFTQSDLTLRHKESVQSGLDKSYCSRTMLSEQSNKPCNMSSLPPRKFSTTHSTQQQYVTLPTKTTHCPVIPERQKDGITEQHSPTHTRNVSPPSPRTPSLPSFQLLPPIDLNYGPGSKFGDSLAGGKNCKCDPTPRSRHDAQCPRHTFAEAQNNMTPVRSTTVSQRSPKTVDAILDLSHDSKPRSLYHSTGSTPHLPYRDRAVSSSRSEDSSYSAGSSEAEHFPLSLFPLPPPLIVRKRVPAPLVLRNVTPPSASAHSSRDSTPVGTPTTPRFSTLNSPSQSSVASPSKKFYTGRPSTNFSPPPFSPPNSPLPKPPVAQDVARRSPEQTIHPLRTVQSNANLRGALPFPAKHRLTSSEPISDQASVPIRRPPKPRPAERPKNIQTYMDTKDQSISTVNPNVETQVQWGYAF
ncbi:hypothetical protein JR316_0004907 [Psilocybe cubensis]|uniref:Uncharacterized protein n=2 Tax=Psilocybe cubensis TaxID=181762 RepID=A0A8H8CLF4_PSICU|nr:hypothetical protein JR316_0004907 [Psilocybe cubensis]KAH9482807.1 hypothetical protein JR316_0004907 [Psilocybe cubensis]